MKKPFLLLLCVTYCFFVKALQLHHIRQEIPAIIKPASKKAGTGRIISFLILFVKVT